MIGQRVFCPMFVNCSQETPLCRSQRANVFSNVDKPSLLGYYLKVTGLWRESERVGTAWRRCGSW